MQASRLGTGGERNEAQTSLAAERGLTPCLPGSLWDGEEESHGRAGQQGTTVCSQELSCSVCYRSEGTNGVCPPSPPASRRAATAMPSNGAGKRQKGQKVAAAQAYVGGSQEVPTNIMCPRLTGVALVPDKPSVSKSRCYY